VIPDPPSPEGDEPPVEPRAELRMPPATLVINSGAPFTRNPSPAPAWLPSPELADVEPAPANGLPLLAIGAGLVVAFVIGYLVHGHSSSAPVTKPAATPSPSAAAAPVVPTAHGTLFGKAPVAPKTACALDGLTLSATGTRSAPLGSQKLTGVVSGTVCSYVFSFPVTASPTVAFHVRDHVVTGPLGSVAKVASGALAGDLFLQVS
jgi:hypothetical protein